MAGSPKFFARKYRLVLDPPTGNSLEFVVEEGKPAMDIKFDVTYARGQTAREGTISILGLSMDTMHTFVELAGMTRGKAMSELVHVHLEAGYFTSAGMVEILDGFAWYATITSPPNMWLNIKVSEYNPLGGKVRALESRTGLKIGAAVKWVASQFSGSNSSDDTKEGVTFVVEDQTEDKVLSQDKTVSISMQGSKSIADAVSWMSENLSDDVQFIMKTSDEDREIRKIIAVDKDKKKATDGEIYIDGDNGLLSVTGIDAVNGCITTFLDGTVEDSMSHLNLQSELNPQANGRYYITKRQYVGHFMGQEWYSRYFCTAREGDPD